MQKNNTERGSMTKEKKITLNAEKRKVIADQFIFYFIFVKRLIGTGKRTI